MLDFQLLKDYYNKFSTALYNIVIKIVATIPAKAYFLLFAAVLSLICTALIFTPYIIRDSLTKNLRALGNKSISIRDVDFNPFTGYVALRGISVFNGQHPELKINAIIATLDWRKALSRNIVAESIRITGATVTVRYKNNKWFIGGFPAQPNKKKKLDKQPLNYYIKKAALRNINLRFISGKTRRSAFVRQVDLAGLNSKTIKRHGQLRISGTTQGARYDINALLKPFAKSPKFEFRVSVKHFPANQLQIFTRQKKLKMTGSISYLGTWIVDINPNNTFRVRQQGSANFFVKKFSSPKMHIHSKKIKVSLRSNSTINMNNGSSKTNVRYSALASMMKFIPSNGSYTMQLNKVRSKGNITLNKSSAGTKVFVAAAATIRRFDSRDRRAKVKLLTAHNIRLHKITYSDRKGLKFRKISTAKVSFAQTVKASKGLAGEFNKRLMHAKSLVIRNLNITPKPTLKVSINGIYPVNLRVFLYRDAQQWPILALAKKSMKSIKLDLPPLRINTIKLKGYNHITVVDRSFKRPFKTKIRIRRMHIRGINTRKLNNNINFLVMGTIDRYTRYRFIGKARPFTKNINLQLKGNIRELILRKFSRYSKRHYGYGITSGHLDAKFKLKISHSQLSGKNTFTLRRLAIKRIKGHPRDKANRKLPLKTVIKLLSNSRNEIKVVVPNSGNLNDPAFQFGINYKKAFNTVFKRGLVLALKYTQPVGQAFTLFSSAKKLITSFRMKPVRFRGGSSYLSFGSRWGLKKVSKIMRKKKKITVRLCAIYTNSDIEFFQIESGTRRKSRRWAIIKSKRLSLQRASRVKNYLVKKLKVRSGRIFLCKPVHDKRDKKRPRVKFSI
ncbi:hypothetical protein MNBD_GAMMA12-1183 [hydrothermal vent metagenome]|uniref:AsmA domain-containing protein n=1 Tax=hydrothermal vent metagenome TaxID=652676 RepID=A0A3B0YBN5_9ZZZZ